MPEPHDLHAELHRHAGALRRIARELVRDADVADDVAQDTVRAALAAENLQPGPLGGWLQRTLENFVRQWRRSERRRRARHAELPSPATVRTPLEVLDRRETLAALTEAVLGLAEPYQTAVFLRYFADLPPRAIAQRTGQNLATVKSRLHRGLDLLRERLDRRCGDREQWRLAFAATFGLPLGTAAAGLTLTTGAWLVSTAVKVTAAVCLLGASALLLLSHTQEPQPLAQAAPPSSPPPAATAAVLDTVAANASTLREAAVRAGAPDLAWLDHPFVHELEVQFVDALGLPVEGRSLRCAPPRCTLTEPAVTSDAEGRLRITWPARQPTGEVIVNDERGVLRRIPVQHGRPTALVAGRTSDRIRKSITLSLGTGQAMELAIAATEGGQGLAVLGKERRTLDAPATPHALHPFARFGITGPRPAVAGGPSLATNLDVTLVGGAFGARVHSLETLISGPSLPTPAARGIAGTVFLDDGTPAPKIPVMLLGAGPQPLQATETDAQGAFQFPNLAEGTFTVRAGGTSAGLASLPTAVTTGMTPVVLHLQRGSCVRGTVLDREHQPIANASVVWRAADESWWDSTTTDQQGKFVLANLPSSGGTVLVWPVPGLPLLAFATRAVLNDNGELVLQAPAAEGGLQWDLADGADGTAPQAEVRVWQVDTGLGQLVAPPKAGKPWSLKRLPAGYYRIEVHTAAGGWQDFDSIYVDGTGTTDLGTIQSATACQVAIDTRPAAGTPAGAAMVELYQLRPDLDVRVDCGELPPQAELTLPAGDYVLACRRGDGPVRFERFTAVPRAPTAVTLPR